MAESKEDGEENRDNGVIPGLTDSVHTLVMSEMAARAFGFDTANDARLAIGSVTMPKHEGRYYRGFVLLPSHYHVLIDTFQQRL